MKKYCFLSVFLCATLLLHATNHIDLYGGGGMGSLGYSLRGGQSAPDYTYTAGVGYTWFSVSGLGLQVGLQLTRLGASASLTNEYVWGEMLTDYQGDVYEHRITFADWREQQELYLVELPLGFRFRHYGSSRAGLHAALGVKLSVPLLSRYSLAHSTITHYAYYPDWNLTLHDLPERFITESPAPFSDTNTARLNRWNGTAYLELGTTIQCSAHLELIIAAYGQYMFTDLTTGITPEVLGFASAANGYTFMPSYRGLLGTDAVDAMHPWTAGLKLGLSVWAGRTPEQRKRQLRRLAEEFPEQLPVVERRDTVYIRDTTVVYKLYCPQEDTD